MKYRTRIYLNAEQRANIWDRWQRGESMSSIGRLFERVFPVSLSWPDHPSPNIFQHLV